MEVPKTMALREIAERVDEIQGRFGAVLDELRNLAKQAQENVRNQEDCADYSAAIPYEAGYAAGIEYARMMLMPHSNDLSNAVSDAFAEAEEQEAKPK
jgi:hypothetical protein